MAVPPQRPIVNGERGVTMLQPRHRRGIKTHSERGGEEMFIAIFTMAMVVAGVRDVHVLV